MTITRAPVAPVVHPADLVIDQYGTFLGKRSERLVVRWRETEHPLPDEGATGTQSSTAVVQFPRPNSVQTHAEESQSESDPPREENAADIATSELLNFWRESRAIPARPQRPKARHLGQLLQDLGEGAPSSPDRNGWSEQLVPLSRLRSVLVSGRGVTISSDLIGALVERGITLAFLSGRGDPLALVSAPGLSGTVQTRRSQLEAYTTPLGVNLAVEFIRGKLRNQKHQLQYSGKYLKSSDPERFTKLSKKIAAIGAIRQQLEDFEADNLASVRDKLMGYEGTAARIYWEGVSLLLEGNVQFPGRLTRGAIDPVNSALNYGYGILYSQVSGALANAGLELFAGFLHVDRPGKPSLVLDLVEEFRAPVVDRVILALVKLGVSLEANEHGLTVASRREVSDRILDRLSTVVPYEGKRWQLLSVIQQQARHLAVAVRGERIYRSFASRW